MKPCPWRALIGCLLAPLTSVAQPADPDDDEIGAGRELVVTGAPGERPVVYGAANAAVALVFDAPLQRSDAGVVAPPGADVRPHPYLANALFVTPSMELARRGASPLQVSLEDAGVRLVLAFNPERIDHVLRIMRRPAIPDAGHAVSRTDLQELLSTIASGIFKDGACAPLRSPLGRAEEVVQNPSIRKLALVCVAGTFSYVRVKRTRPACVAVSARLLGGNRDMEVLLMEPAPLGKEGAVQVLVVRTPLEKVRDLELLLLAADGTVCEQHPNLTLQPGDAP